MEKFVIDYPEYAHLVAEWHPDRNQFPDPETGYVETRTPHNMKHGSSKPVWWKCSRVASHEWSAVLSSRTGAGNGCPYCANKKLTPGLNDLATVNPELAAQWHPTLNGKNNPGDFAPQSNAKAFWICPAGGPDGPAHEWEAIIQARHKGNGCPYCGNRKVLTGFNDLSTKRPDIAAEWHPTNNGDLKPTDVSASANKKVWWKCANNHEWEAYIGNRTGKGSGCKQCNKMKPRVARDTVTSKPDLLASWHPDNVKHADEVSLGSLMMAKWICAKDNRHVWEATVANRDRGGKCTVCSGHTIITGVNDLTTLHPELAAQWHPDNERSVGTVGVGTEYMATWICAQGHMWKALIYPRVRQNQGCPECSGRRAWKDGGHKVSDFPTLAEKWHPDNILAPEEVGYRSAQSVLWKCSVNEAHVWSSPVYRQSLTEHICQVCSGYALVVGLNDFASHASAKVLSEWHPDNDFLPTEITRGSERLVKWQCPNDESHVWSCKAYDRARRNRMPQRCPQCYQYAKRSAGEDDLFENIEEMLDGTSLTAFQSIRDQIGGQELDIFIPEAKFAIEFNGLYYHSAKFQEPDYHAQKLAACQKAGIRLHAVWEDDWLERPEQVMDAIASRLGMAEERTRKRKALVVLDYNVDSAASHAPSENDEGATEHTKGEALAFLNAREPNKARLLDALPEDVLFTGVVDPAGLRSAMAYTVGADTQGKPTVTIHRFHLDSGFDLGLLTEHIQAQHPHHDVLLYADLSASDEQDFRDCGFVQSGAQKPASMLRVGRTRVAHDVNDPFALSDDLIHGYGRAVMVRAA